MAQRWLHSSKACEVDSFVVSMCKRVQYMPRVGLIFAFSPPVPVDPPSDLDPRLSGPKVPVELSSLLCSREPVAGVDYTIVSSRPKMHDWIGYFFIVYNTLYSPSRSA